MASDFIRNDVYSAKNLYCLLSDLFSPILLTVNYRDYITIEPNKRGGKPCARGLRITVYEVLEYLASEMTEEEILEDFPDLTREDLKACIAYAADRERRLMNVPHTLRAGKYEKSRKI